jgi:hypothetical protein
VTESITQVLSCAEIHTGFDALIARIADMALERDRAQAAETEAVEAACRMQQERDRAQREALLQEHIADSLRAELDEAAADNRRLSLRCHDLAVTVGVLEQQIDRMQNPPEARRDDHTRRWPFRRAGGSL